MTVAVFGGAFDPPHRGHVELARRAKQELGVDRLLVLVAAAPGHKTVETPASGNSARHNLHSTGFAQRLGCQASKAQIGPSLHENLGKTLRFWGIGAAFACRVRAEKRKLAPGSRPGAGRISLILLEPSHPPPRPISEPTNLPCKRLRTRS